VSSTVEIDFPFFPVAPNTDRSLLSNFAPALPPSSFSASAPHRPSRPPVPSSLCPCVALLRRGHTWSFVRHHRSAAPCGPLPSPRTAAATPSAPVLPLAVRPRSASIIQHQEQPAMAPLTSSSTRRCMGVRNTRPPPPTESALLSFPFSFLSFPSPNTQIDLGGEHFCFILAVSF
jgi:hypothetical protein